MNATHSSSEVHSFYLLVEDQYNWAAWQQWCSARPHYPAVAVIVYVLLIRYGPVFMMERKEMRMKALFFLWNSALSLFSMVASYRAISYVIHNMKTEDFSIGKILCDNEPDNVSGFWCFLFTMSKFVELGDTLFLILRKKPILFLHWYHHLTVLLFTWLATIVNAPVGKFFATMNVFVHSLMYAYYAIQTLGLIRLPRLVGISITSLQIAQMIAGIMILVLSYILSLNSNACRSPTVILIAGALIYGSYFALFVDFFLNAYFAGGKKSKIF